MAKITSFSLPLRENIDQSFQGASAGLISSVASSSLTVTNAGWNPGALSQEATPYFVRIKSGNGIGRTFQISTSTPNTAQTITVLNEGTDLTGIIAPNDKFEIFPADTLLSFFGAGNATGNGAVLSGTAATGDLVRIMEGASWSEYHFNASANQWRRGSVPVNMNNVVLRPDRGIFYVRRAQSPLEFVLTGVVPDTKLQMVYNNLGATFLDSGFPVDRTLAQLAYNTLPGWVSKNAGNTISDADKIQVFDGTAWNQYHFDATLNQWRRGSVPVDMSSTVVPAGRPILVEKRSGSPGTAVMTRNLPYSLN